MSARCTGDWAGLQPPPPPVTLIAKVSHMLGVLDPHGGGCVCGSSDPAWLIPGLFLDFSPHVPGILKSTCHIDVRWFPFDVQKCDMKFGSWSHGSWTLDLQMLKADISSYVPNGEWDLIGKRDQWIAGSQRFVNALFFPPEVNGRVNQNKYDCCEEMYPDVTFTVVMQRRTLYYGINLLLPCVLISTLALLVFVLPADSGEKISLG